MPRALRNRCRIRVDLSSRRRCGRGTGGQLADPDDSTNLRETEVVLEAASRYGVPILLTSTSEVYGKSQKPAFSEEDDLLIGPPHLGRWSYACSKLMDEFLAMAFARDRKLPVSIDSLFNTVGQRLYGTCG